MLVDPPFLSADCQTKGTLVWKLGRSGGFHRSLFVLLSSLLTFVQSRDHGALAARSVRTRGQRGRGRTTARRLHGRADAGPGAASVQSAADPADDVPAGARQGVEQ